MRSDRRRRWPRASARNSSGSTLSDSPNCGGTFDLDAKRDTLRRLEERMSAPGFWDNQESAQAVVQQVKAVKNWIEPFDAVTARVQSAQELEEMLALEPDEEMGAEVEREVQALAPEIE